MIVVRLHSDLEVKYLGFLNELYWLCAEQKQFTMKALCRKHNISVISATILLRDGLLVKMPAAPLFGSPLPFYEWRALKPDMRMARLLIEEVRQYYREQERGVLKHELEYRITCAHCHESFHANVRRRKYCSSECRHEAYKQRKNSGPFTKFINWCGSILKRKAG